MVFRLKEEIAIGSPVTFIHVVCVEILYPALLPVPSDIEKFPEVNTTIGFWTVLKFTKCDVLVPYP
jgi:hypothetical protein